MLELEMIDKEQLIKKCSKKHVQAVPIGNPKIITCSVDLTKKPKKTEYIHPNSLADAGGFTRSNPVSDGCSMPPYLNGYVAVQYYKIIKES